MEVQSACVSSLLFQAKTLRRKMAMETQKSINYIDRRRVDTPSQHRLFKRLLLLELEQKNVILKHNGHCFLCYVFFCALMHRHCT